MLGKVGEVRRDVGKGEVRDEMWGSVLGPHTLTHFPTPSLFLSPHPFPTCQHTSPLTPYTLPHTSTCPQTSSLPTHLSLPSPYPNTLPYTSPHSSPHLPLQPNTLPHSPHAVCTLPHLSPHLPPQFRL